MSSQLSLKTIVNATALLAIAFANGGFHISDAQKAGETYSDLKDFLQENHPEVLEEPRADASETPGELNLLVETDESGQIISISAPIEATPDNLIEFPGPPHPAA